MEMKYTVEHLKEMQALPLYRKVGITIARITEFYDHFRGKVAVSFSGGKDSTVLLTICRRIYPDIKAVFADTGLEYPEIRQFVKTFDNVDVIRPEMPFNKVIEKYGYPVVSKEVAQHIEYYRGGMPYAKRLFDNLRNGQCPSWRERLCRKWVPLLDAPFKITAKCCDVMKKKPFDKYVKETGLHPIIASMAEESMMRKTSWLKVGCNAFDSKHPRSTPMAFWTEQDVLEYLLQMQLPIASVYGEIVRDEKTGKLHTTGESRTGCMFCLFGEHLKKAPNKFQRLAKTHPKYYSYILDKLGFREVMDYMHIPYEPISEEAHNA